MRINIMADIRIERLAQTLVQYSVAVRPGETVALNGEISALPLLRETYKEVIRAGGLCVTNLSDEAMTDYYMRHGNDEQLGWVSPLEHWFSEEVKVRIFIRASTNTRSNTTVDPKRTALFHKARQGLMKARMDRSASNDLRWTLTQFPTEAYAQEADMSLDEFEDFVYGATFCDQPDPIGRWKQLYADQQKYVDWIAGRKQVQVRGPNVDLSLS